MQTAVIEAFDARADGSRRRVEVSEQQIVIARRLGGVEMRIRLIPRQFRGVLLAALAAEATDFLFQVRLLHTDPDLDVTLFETGDEADARAQWRGWAQRLGLSRLVERSETEIEVDRTPSAAAPCLRRRGGATSKRRNRFLMRRKSGVWPPIG